MAFFSSSSSQPRPNRLINAASPYLRQHAYNPVDWYPWGKEALQRAKKENKPILVSIGYSTCYWCHVMERDVFENAEIARLMNQHFINIKVDREERPDLDEIYMIARQMITREGGWPNNVYLTPDLKPFFAGGTFSADDRYGKPGFANVLHMLQQSWTMKRKEVDQVADGVAQRIQHFLSSPPAAGQQSITRETIDKVAQHLLAIHDKHNGGFYQSPKFPQETNLLFLLDYYAITGEGFALDIVTRSLDMMAAGGIYDQIGGGFHRYSTDAQWHVPHFEKMLYNQALLSQAYIKAFTITEKPYYETIARRTLDFVAQSMSGSRGQFYSAFDAETDAVEGSYYVWSHAELKSLLSAGAYQFLMEVYELEDLPIFAGHKHPEGLVLYARRPLDQIARERGTTYDELQSQLDKVFSKLLLARSSRKPPMLDDKVISGWNGMMITAFAEAGLAFEEPRYVERAEQAAEFIMSAMVKKDGGLERIWHNDTNSVDGFLEDYAFVVQGFLAVARATGKKEWIRRAIDIINKADDDYYDRRFLSEGKGGFFFTRNAKDLIVKIKTADDAAIPSANAIMVHSLVDMEVLTRGTEWEHKVWRERALETVRAFSHQVLATPERYVGITHGYLRLQQQQVGGVAALSPVGAGPVTGVSEPSYGQQALSSANYVRLEAAFDKKNLRPGEDGILNLTLKIAEGWHINTNPAPLEFLVPTTVSVSGDGDAVEVIRVAYPPANGFSMWQPGGMLEVYQKEIQIPVTLQLNRWARPGELLHITLSVTYQACGENTCLQPASVKMELPLVVSGN